MNIGLRSVVKCDLQSVFERFDAALFRYLLPPGAQLIAFEGSRKGDKVHLKLPMVGEWISEITEDGATEDVCFFIDEGVRLPFPLRRWRHQHILRRRGAHTIIEDKMNYSSGNVVVDALLYPVLYLSFLPRVFQYKKYFE
jgi:ligand-binding SRPBCC domain-containing protein